MYTIAQLLEYAKMLDAVLCNIEEDVANGEQVDLEEYYDTISALTDVTLAISRHNAKSIVDVDGDKMPLNEALLRKRNLLRELRFSRQVEPERSVDIVSKLDDIDRAIAMANSAAQIELPELDSYMDMYYG